MAAAIRKRANKLTKEERREHFQAAMRVFYGAKWPKKPLAVDTNLLLDLARGSTPPRDAGGFPSRRLHAAGRANVFEELGYAALHGNESERPWRKRPWPKPPVGHPAV